MKKFYLGLLGLCSSIWAQEIPKQAIQTALQKQQITKKWAESDIAHWEVVSQTSSESTGITNYFIRQTLDGLPIFESVTTVWVKKSAVIQVGDRFIPRILQKADRNTKVQPAATIFQKATQELGYTLSPSVLKQESATKVTLTNGDAIDDPIQATLGYLTVNDRLQKVWYFEFYSPNQEHLWSLYADAASGSIVQKNDLTVRCQFDHPHSPAQSASPIFFFEKSVQKAVSPLQVQSGNYRVIPFEFESPNHSPFQLISSPANALASPKGWHDTNNLSDNTPTLKYTYTRGNNVWARADYTNTNPTAHSTNPTANGYAPDGGSSLTFDFPYGGVSVQPNTYINAAVTNLFYMNNCLHDVWYQYGFNEQNGNFQQNNFGRGGSGSDFVWADAQDGSRSNTPTFNNANFSTPADGTRPRMQMYVWNVAPPIFPVTVNSPASVAGNYRAVQNVFNPGFVSLPQAPNFIQSNLVLYQDGTGGLNEACVPPSNGPAMNGKIVIIRRGNCNFTVKVKNAQTRGAVAVIIVNNVSEPEFVSMSGADATITIPAICMSFDDGENLIGNTFGNSVNVRLQLNGAPFVSTDGDFDNGIISHEYGHGISNRLTGGPSLSNCLTNEEQMGEGWSDWFALMLQMKPGDLGTTPKGIGTFAVSQSTTGRGIRRFPYTTDMTINPSTFATVNDNFITDADGNSTVSPHNIGEVWCAMLWDLTWAYVAKYGYDNNKYTGTGGNNRVMRLVLDGLKLQPCNPSFTEARDALIAADQATTGGADYCMIWEVFARRGLGINASSGNRNDSADQVEDFTQPAPGPNCTALGTSIFENSLTYRVYPNPATNEVFVELPNYSSAVEVRLIDIHGRVVYQAQWSNGNINRIPIGNFQTGMYLLQATGESIQIIEKIIKN